MPTLITIPPEVKLITDIVIQEVCDFSQGHCYGSDGGTGVPANRKVAPGRGGNQEVWTLSLDGLRVDKKQVYLKCQFCQKYVYSQDIEEGK